MANNHQFYVEDLPYNERKHLCWLLDRNDSWKELGSRFLKLRGEEMYTIGNAVLRKQSPTDELLDLMETRHCSMDALFSWLNQMQHFHAMYIIKAFVDPKHHHLIPENAGLERVPFPGWRNENAHRTHVNRDNKENVRTIEHTKHGNEGTTARKLSDASDVEKIDLGIPLFRFEELEQATNGWDPRRELGSGGFGVVYKGYLRETDFAIKRLKPPKKNEPGLNAQGTHILQSLKELNHLNISRHDNILPLYGYAINGPEYILVYQYMPNGTLDDRLHKNNSEYLPWNIRYKVARGTARGLQFLHGMDPPLIHGDIKSANILLDQYFDPKIGDFGLARVGPSAQCSYVKVSRAYGTRPYLPDEFIRSKKFSKKVDVYSFGVLLFEIATGRKPYEEARLRYLKNYVCDYEESLISNLMDLRGKHENRLYFTLFKSFIDKGKECVHEKPRHRPEMIDVFKFLDQCDSGPSIPPFYLPRRNSLIPPTPTSISPNGSPLQTNQASNRAGSPSPSHQSPSGIHPAPRNPTPVPPPQPPPIHQVAEVSSSNKASSSGNGAAHVESYAVAEQNSLRIPVIELTPPNEPRASTRNVECAPSSSLSNSSSESEASTPLTSSSNVSAESDKKPDEEKEYKETDSQNLPRWSVIMEK